MDAKEQAKQYYLEGMAIKDIADKLGKTAGTVRSWKSRGKWDDPPSEATVAENATVEKNPKKKDATQRNKKSATLQRNTATQHENVATKILEDEWIEELNESDLKDRQKAFVIEYMKSFNATQAYLNVYGGKYNVASVEGSRLLRNPKIQDMIQEFRKEKFNQIAITREDLILDLVKEARADIGDVVDFGRYDELATDREGDVYLDTNDEPITFHHSWVQVKDKDKVDTSLIKKISKGKDGLNVEMHDRDKARKQLFEQLAEMDEESVVDNENGLMNAINKSTGGTFGDEDEIET